MSAEHLDGAVGGLPFDELLCRLLDMVACLLGSPRGSDVSNRILLERIRNCETLTRQLQGVQTMVIAEVVAATGSATCPGQGDADASGDEGRNGDNAASKGVAGAGRGAADEDEDEDTASVIGSRSRVAAEIAPLLCISRAWAGSLVVAAVRLEQNLPDILGLVCSGELDWYRAKLISDRLHHPLVGPAWFRPGCPEWRLFQAVLAKEAPKKTAPQLKRFIADLLLSLDPDDANARHRRAKAAREVRFDALPDGMAALYGVFTADVAQMIDGVLDAMADACRDQAQADGVPDPRSHQQRRADAVAALFEAIATGADIPLVRDPSRPEPERPEAEDGAADRAGAELQEESEGLANGNEHHQADARRGESAQALKDILDAHQTERDRQLAQFGLEPLAGGQVLGWWRKPRIGRSRRGPHLVVTMTDAALLGVSEEPGILMGYGGISAELARKIASAAQKVTVLKVRHPVSRPRAEQRGYTAEVFPDPNEAVEAEPSVSAANGHADPAAKRYRPTQQIIDLVMARYQSCTHPGCSVPAVRCDVDHVVPFGAGGPTCQCNLHPACRAHHRLKTFGGWKVRRTRPGAGLPVDTVIWISPAGFEYVSEPTSLPGNERTLLSLLDGSELTWGRPRESRTGGGGEQRGGPVDREVTEKPDRTSAARRTAERLSRWRRALQRALAETERRDRLRANGARRDASAAADGKRGAEVGHGEPTF